MKVETLDNNSSKRWKHVQVKTYHR